MDPKDYSNRLTAFPLLMTSVNVVFMCERYVCACARVYVRACGPVCVCVCVYVWGVVCTAENSLIHFYFIN